MYRSANTALLMLAASALTACAESTLPEQDRYVLPEPDRSIDPAALVIGAYIATPCGGNEDLRTRGERVLVDIFFGRKSTMTPLIARRRSTSAR